MSIDDAYGNPHGQIDFNSDAGRKTMFGMIHVERRSDSTGYLAKLMAFAEQSSHNTLNAIIEEYKSTTSNH